MDGSRDQHEWMTMKELADRFKVSYPTVKRWKKRGMKFIARRIQYEQAKEWLISNDTK